MLLYSILFPIIAIIAIVWFLVRYLKEKNSLVTTILWTIFWILVSLFAVFPNFSNSFARLFGITRGLDFIIIIVFAVLVYTIFKLYTKMDKLEDDVNKIVKEVALNNEISLDDKEE
ncbi:hypothetical protein TL18_04025 [Methanobrevibacter sp. YE315]|uniref:DUF2304 domain-containing protein n=1 Tax=Methanobrevibacter sp. YE315 TaxID=1609968 RepID=UPI000764D6F9|nr:DUF2304 family protein [Methanobrevibacter sp. YE315]AMD17262.1 hypothetical protein TL18_04025 [Methanobrevibacter sp. YE315]